MEELDLILSDISVSFGFGFVPQRPPTLNWRSETGISGRIVEAESACDRTGRDGGERRCGEVRSGARQFQNGFEIPKNTREVTPESMQVTEAL